MICIVSDQPLSGPGLREESGLVLLSQGPAILFDCVVCVSRSPPPRASDDPAPWVEAFTRHASVPRQGTWCISAPVRVSVILHGERCVKRFFPL